MLKCEVILERALKVEREKEKWMKGTVATWIGLAVLTVAPAWGGGGNVSWVGRFSIEKPDSPPPGWGLHHFPKISRHTTYLVDVVDGKTVLKAESKASASALVKKVDINPLETPYLEWSWKVESEIKDAQWGQKKRDDFPARLFVVFEKKGGPFSFFGRFINSLSGGLPGRSLNYVWNDGSGEEKMARSPYTGKVMMVAAGPGGDGVGKWIEVRRNIADDFKKAFRKIPGRVIAVALMTDTDNTRSSVTTYYGDIRFSSQ
ncbi:MAG: DUF3047 domain-containing protein [Acidobacteriota bacterium]